MEITIGGINLEVLDRYFLLKHVFQFFKMAAKLQIISAALHSVCNSQISWMCFIMNHDLALDKILFI